MKKKWKQYIWVLIGIFISSLSFNLFLSPNNLVTGGVSGLSIIINNFFHIKESIFMLIANMILIVCSFLFLGKEKTKNTIIGAIIFPLFVMLTENISEYIVITIEPILLAVIAGFVSGIGNGLVYKNNFTSGGTDIISQLIEKYVHIPMSKAILIIDGPIILLGWAAFGFTNMVYALISLIIMSLISNNTMLELNQHRLLYITTQKREKIRQFLISEHEYDVTLLSAVGGYTNKDINLIICSVHNYKYVEIKEAILHIDPNAFITVTNAYEQKINNDYIKLSLSEKEC